MKLSLSVGVVAVLLGTALSSCGSPRPPVAAQTQPAQPVTRAESWRKSMDLSGEGWKLWRDKQAKWQTDKLYLPPVKLAELPINPPTVGWEKLLRGGPEAPKEIVAAQVPGTVEAYLWGADGDPTGTNGNYQGVSWWWREFTIPADWQGKQLILKFDACRLRSEVFVNEQLVGYDAVGNTPFDVDISRAAKIGQVNRLAVRITDPNGNEADNSFDWADYRAKPWGTTTASYPSSHGFGGITGRLKLIGVDSAYVSDIFVRNKPSPSAESPTDIDVDVELTNATDSPVKGTLTLRIFEKGKPGKAIYEQSWDDVSVVNGKSVMSKAISTPEARLWDLDHPNLYECEASLRTVEAEQDAMKVTFGYRWFGPDGINTPNAVLRLNGKRVFFRTAISWGYWPINGIFPTEALAERQTRVAKELGLNALFMHRTIADPLLMEKADELGLLLYTEPGGYKCDFGDETAFRAATEKLMRFIRRDRNHPSVAVWGMINEIWVREDVVRPHFLKDMVEAHKLDPSRAIVLASGQRIRTQDPRWSWMAPYETTRRETGWWDQHAAGGPAVYHDGLYNNPTSYYGSDWGADNVITAMSEQGAISSPPPLDEMVREYEKAGRLGWDGDEYIRLKKSYGAWLDAHHGRDAFPTLDDLCRSLGNIAYYHQGRVIESIRAGNRVDFYAINGWDCSKIDNHSGIVDPWRHPKGDVELLRYYLQPLYVAVKVRRKVAEPGGQMIVDISLINEKNVQGEATLEVVAVDPQGNEQFRKRYPVNVKGQDQYGQLLQSNIAMNVGPAHGYTSVKARLLDARDRVLAEGRDEVFVVDYRNEKIPEGGLLIDTGGSVRRFLEALKYAPTRYGEAKGPAPFIVISDMPSSAEVARNLLDILERVKNDGSTLVLLHRPEQWADLLKARKVIQYDGELSINNTGWMGGGYFALRSPLLEGLPQATGLNWEYQKAAMSQQDPPRRGLLLRGDEAAVGCFQSNDVRMATVLGAVPYGKGKIVLTTLPIYPNLSGSDPSNAVLKRIFVNILAHGSNPMPAVAATGPTTVPATQQAATP